MKRLFFVILCVGLCLSSTLFGENLNEIQKQNLNINDENQQYFDKFHEAIQNKNYQKMQEILKIKPNLINLKDKSGANLLLKNVLETDACDNEMANFLLKNGLEITVPIQLVELEFCVLMQTASIELKYENTNNIFRLGLTPDIMKNYLKLHGVNSDYLANYLHDDEELFLLFLENNYFEFGENFDEIKNLAFDIIGFVEQSSGGKYHKDKPIPNEILDFVKSEKYSKFRDNKLKIMNKILDKKPLNELNKGNKFWLELLYKITNDEKIKEILIKG
ncbi:hypothetical protein OFO03_04580 [Campylobacter sp. JMF_02 ED1]|uniref:hypothetical protein n=1 Tax=unclassified Campylobacter TaxID=2593542 RepID=UPI0022E9C4B8|nr:MULTISPECIES: hypothetical protein [unclassified Campylobacter]MDA3049405.1 hypothetical protein [Campylobacter sp. JMF_15 NE4]MDA3051167.1 hypothetical protein [Campylobacter sp. JMF_02 ED1]